MRISENILIILSLVSMQNVLAQRVNHNTGHLFVPILNKDISPSQININLIQTSLVNSRFDCINNCKKIINCILILFKSNQCNLYNTINEASFISVTLIENSYLFKRIIDDYTSINSHLKYYWTFNNDLTDIISGVKLSIGVNGYFTTDRLNRRLSSIKLSKGYLQGPSGNFFSGDFTISTWVKVTDFFPMMRFFEFSSPSCDSVVRVLFTDEVSNNSFVRIWNTGTTEERVYSNIQFKLNKWHHFVISLNSTTSELYIDNKLVGQGPSKPAPVINYTNTFIGKYCLSDTVYGSFELDDLKIFDAYLNQQEILKVMNSFY